MAATTTSSPTIVQVDDSSRISSATKMQHLFENTIDPAVMLQGKSVRPPTQQLQSRKTLHNNNVKSKLSKPAHLMQGSYHPTHQENGTTIAPN